MSIPMLNDIRATPYHAFEPEIRPHTAKTMLEITNINPAILICIAYLLFMYSKGN